MGQEAVEIVESSARQVHVPTNVILEGPATVALHLKQYVVDDQLALLFLCHAFVLRVIALPRGGTWTPTSTILRPEFAQFEGALISGGGKAVGSDPDT